MICPCCRGTGTTPSLGIRCSWCNETGHVTIEVARRYADLTLIIANGGFICGDHDYKDMERMRAEAAAVHVQADKEEFRLP